VPSQTGSPKSKSGASFQAETITSAPVAEILKAGNLPVDQGAYPWHTFSPNNFWGQACEKNLGCCVSGIFPDFSDRMWKR
jgi:hypothetical protein